MANGKHGGPPKVLVAVLVLALVSGVGYWVWSTQQKVSAATTFSGTVEATEYQVAAAISGRIVELDVAEGDSVKKGDVIARLDDTALKLQVQQAQAGVRAAKAQVTQAKDTGTDAEVDASKARLAQAVAAVKLAQVQLGYATVKSPATGVVVSVPANAGQNASPGKTLVTLADPVDLFVRVYVPEPSIGDVSLGQKATVRSTGGSFDGTVSFIASQAEFTPNTVETKEQRGNLVYEVRVAVTDTTGALKSGLPVDVEFAAK